MYMILAITWMFHLFKVVDYCVFVLKVIYLILQIVLKFECDKCYLDFSVRLTSNIEGDICHNYLNDLNPVCCYVDAWTIQLSPPCFSSLDIINEYLIIDGVGYQ